MLFYEELNGKVKLQNARLNLVDFVYRVWTNDDIISKKLIINGFNHAGLIKYYSSYEEDKINEGYLYDLINDDKYEILDDISNDLNIAEEELEDNLEEEEEEIGDKKDNEDANNAYLEDKGEGQISNLIGNFIHQEKFDEEKKDKTDLYEKFDDEEMKDKTDLNEKNIQKNDNYIKNSLNQLELDFSKDIIMNMNMDFTEIQKNNESNMDLDDE
jgi:hypothetical protein